MSIARSLPSPRRVASHAALLGLALASLLGTTGCSTCCDPCRPVCCPPSPPAPASVVPTGTGTLTITMAPVPQPPPVAPPPPAPAATPTMEACRAFLTPPSTPPPVDKTKAATKPATQAQLDRGGFILWQVQAGAWQHVGWVYSDVDASVEHWIFKTNYTFPRCLMAPDAGTSSTIAFTCMNPALRTWEQFLPAVREMNGGTTVDLYYFRHAYEILELPLP